MTIDARETRLSPGLRGGLSGSLSGREAGSAGPWGPWWMGVRSGWLRAR